MINIPGCRPSVLAILRIVVASAPSPVANALTSPVRPAATAATSVPVFVKFTAPLPDASIVAPAVPIVNSRSVLVAPPSYLSVEPSMYQVAGHVGRAADAADRAAVGQRVDRQRCAQVNLVVRNDIAVVVENRILGGGDFERFDIFTDDFRGCPCSCWCS